MKLAAIFHRPGAISQTLLYGLSIALMKSVSLLMLPVVTFYLDPRQFGQLEILSSVAIIGSILVGLGLESTFFRFAGKEKNLNKKKVCAANILSLALIIGIIAGLSGWLVAPLLVPLLPADITAYQLRLVWTVFALEGIIAIPLAWLRMRDKVFIFVLATTGRALLQSGLVFLFLQLNLGVDGVLLASAIVAIVQAAVLLLIQIRDCGINISKAKITHYLGYSWPIVASGLVAFVLVGLDRWLLAQMASIEQVAIYGVTSKLAIATVILIQPFGMWWLPRRFAILNQQDGAKKVAYYISIGITLVMIVAVMVSIIAPILIKGLLPEHYHGATEFIWGLVLAMTFKEIAELVNIGCFTGQSTRGQLIINIISAAIGVVLMLLTIPTLKIWGVVLALNLAYLSKACLYFLLSQYHLPLPYPGKKLLIMAVICALSMSVSFFVPVLLPIISTVTPPTFLPVSNTALNIFFSLLFIIVLPITLCIIAVRLRLFPPINPLPPYSVSSSVL